MVQDSQGTACEKTLETGGKRRMVPANARFLLPSNIKIKPKS